LDQLLKKDLNQLLKKNKYITLRWRFLYVIYLSVYIFMYFFEL